MAEEQQNFADAIQTVIAQYGYAPVNSSIRKQVGAAMPEADRCSSSDLQTAVLGHKREYNILSKNCTGKLKKAQKITATRKRGNNPLLSQIFCKILTEASAATKQKHGKICGKNDIIFLGCRWDGRR